MSIWCKTELGPDEYRRFWLQPLGTPAKSSRAPLAGRAGSAERARAEAAAAEHIAWLLETDTALRRAAARPAAEASSSSSSSDAGGAKQDAVVLPAAPAAVMAGAEPRCTVSVGPLAAAVERVLSVLHFAVLFWPFEAQHPKLRKAYDEWWATVLKAPMPADDKYRLKSEVRRGKTIALSASCTRKRQMLNVTGLW